MTVRLTSIELRGLDPHPVGIEVDVLRGMPSFSIIGLASVTVQQSRERLRSAIRNSRFVFPLTRKVVNLTPASFRKHGTQHDLPIALGLLAASGQIPVPASSTVFLGELGLDGELRPPPGILALILAAARAGSVVVSPPLLREDAELLDDTPLFIARSLADAAAFARGRSLPRLVVPPLREAPASLPFAGIIGQTMAKRAALLSVAGRHNLLLIGPPGTGKTLLAHAVRSLLPAPGLEERREIRAASTLPGSSCVDPSGTRPFRAPHHTARRGRLLGTGKEPGELLLAHRGILFLDELPLFERSALDALREPLETMDGVRLPQIVIGAFNPCACGPRGACVCSPAAKAAYLRRLESPLLERFDMATSITAVPPDELLRAEPRGISLEIPGFVEAAVRDRRQPVPNARIPAGELPRYCPLDAAARSLLAEGSRRLGLSSRATHRALRVARTIADADGSESIRARHLQEAFQLRVPLMGSATTRSPVRIPSRPEVPPRSSRTKRTGSPEEKRGHGS